MFNFIKDIKIGFLEQQAQKYLTGAVQALQSDSLSIAKAHLDSGNLHATNAHLTEVIPSLDAIVDLKDKYVKLSERFKHDKDKSVQLAIDWRDFNEMLNKLLTHKESADEMFFQIRSKEIIDRFNTLLQSE